MNRVSQKSIPLFRLRLISLFLALLLWVLFSGRLEEIKLEETRVSRILEVPIGYTGRPSSMEINSSVLKVFVSMSGKESEMKLVSGDMLLVKLDLSEMESGSHHVPIVNESVEIPVEFGSLKIEAIQPRFVRLDVERKIQKTLQIILRSKGKPAEFFELDRMEVNPPAVTVYGPESKLKDLEFLIAEPVDITEQKEDLVGRVVFNYETQVPENTTLEGGADLEYRAVIVEQQSSVNLGSYKPVRPEGIPEFKFRPRSVKVRVKGPITLVNRLESAWLEVRLADLGTLEVPPERWPLTFKWNLGLPGAAMEVESLDTPPEGPLEWPDLARLEELEVIIEPADVEVRQ